MKRIARNIVAGGLALALGAITSVQAEAMPVEPFGPTQTAAPSGVQQVWWRGGWGWRRPFFYGYGWRRPFYGYGWRRPFFYGGYGWRRPYWGWRRW